MERLSEAVPGARFFCEENDRHDDLMAEHLFIIDPIDGTMNFVHHLNHSAISVAYTCRGVLEAGAVYNPYVDEMFSAVKGEGAFLNGKPIHVDPAPLSETVICFGSAPYNPELTARTFALAQRELPHGAGRAAAGLGGPGSVQRGRRPGRGLLRAEHLPLGLCRRGADRLGGRRAGRLCGRQPPALAGRQDLHPGGKPGKRRGIPEAGGI